MSRSYRLLGLFLAVMAALVGVTQLIEKRGSGDSVGNAASPTETTAGEGVLMTPMSQPATTLAAPAPTVNPFESRLLPVKLEPIPLPVAVNTTPLSARV